MSFPGWAFGIAEEDGSRRRFIVIKYPKSYAVWDRHVCQRHGGFFRDLTKAIAYRDDLNKEWRETA